MTNLSPADWVALGIILLMGVRVSFKGFTAEFMSKSGILVGLLIALMFSSVAAEVITAEYPGLAVGPLAGPGMFILTFSALFVFGNLVMRLLLSVIGDVLDILHLNAFDYLLGFALGALEGALIVSLVVYLLRLQTVIPVSGLLSASQIIALLEPYAPQGINLIRQEILPEFKGGR